MASPRRARGTGVQGAGPSSDMATEDMAMSGTMGQVANRDLAHARPDCADHAFQRTGGTPNAKSCDKCFCYVCDVSASTCTMWGTGASAREHCNAFKSISWDRLRALARQGNIAAVKAAFTGIQASEGSSLTTAAMPPPPPPTAAALHKLASKAKSKSVARALRAAADAPKAPKPAWLKAAARRAGQPTPPPPDVIPMPNPAREADMFELGSFSFPVKAIEGSSIADLVKRLVRTDYYAQKLGPTRKSPEYGDMLCLSNIFDRTNDMYGDYDKIKPKHLKLQPAPTTEVEEEISNLRVRKVKVIDCCGRTLPVTVGVQVVKDAKLAQVVEALRAVLQPPPEEGEQLVLAHSQYSSTLTLYEADDEINDRTQYAHYSSIYLYRLPKDPSGRDPLDGVPPPVTWKPDFSRTRYVSVPLWLLVPHEIKPLAAERYLDRFGGDEYGRAMARAMYPYADDFEAEVEDEDEFELMMLARERARSASTAGASKDGYEAGGAAGGGGARGGGGGGEPKPDRKKEYAWQAEALGYPLLLPLPEGHHTGGEEAHEALALAVEVAARPFLKAVGEAVAAAAGGGAEPVVIDDDADDVFVDAAEDADDVFVDAAAANGAERQAKKLRREAKRKPAPKAGAAAAASNGPSALGAPGAAPCAPCEAPGVSFRLYRGNVEMYRSSPPDVSTAFDNATQDLPLPRSGTISAAAVTKYPAAHAPTVTAVWKLEPSRTRASFQYEFAGLERPRVDASASAEALKETDELIKADKARAARVRAREQWPYEVVTELTYSSRRHPPGQSSAVAALAAQGLEECSTCCAVALDLSPASSRPNERRGVATFTVYTWALGTRTVFRRWDEAGKLRGGESIPLKNTMKELFQGTPRNDALFDKIAEIRKSSHEVSSINLLIAYLQSGERATIAQPPGLTITMRAYQLQSLAFMVEAEERPGGYRSLFWLEKTNTAGQSYWFSPILNRVARDVPVQPTGGFLAEEMGLGKTIEVLALILASPPPSSVKAGAVHDAAGRLVSRATLVVCAVSLVGQWVDEAKSKSSGSLKILQYHGSNRPKDVKKVAVGYDLVVTTYQTLARDFSTDDKSEVFKPLGAVHWHRIVFDEGHSVKACGALQTKACVALSAERRWCCTGTPIGTSVEELLGQFAAIHLSPMSTKPFFDAAFKPVFSNASRYHGDASGLATLLYTMRTCLVRHTKLQTLEGEQVLQLPPKTETDVSVQLTPEEQALYLEVHTEISRKWTSFRAAGQATVNKYQLTIMSLLGPLRRICSGGDLRPRDLRLPSLVMDIDGHNAGRLAAANGANMEINADLVSPEADCSICLDNMEHPVVTPCAHWFCRECISGWLSTKDTCTLCRKPLTIPQLKSGVMPGYEPPKVDEDGNGDAGPSDGAEEAEPSHKCESKLRALLFELRIMRESDSTAKALVFSQYTTTLDWLKQRLTEEGFGYRTISGSMALNQRTKAIEAFQKDPPTTVFLLSMRSGAVGINLTAASHVFIMEPCLNPALEAQAIGRAWRMGQQRPVVVKRFFAKGSVEEAVVEIVRARQNHGHRNTGGASGSGGGASDSGGGAGPSGGGPGPNDDAQAAVLAAAEALLAEVGGSWRSGGINRAIAEVVAGNIRSDKQALRMGELELLFAPPTFGAAAALAAVAGGAAAAAGGDVEMADG
ncbi:hypothetical protein FOA52_015404 [Chlamydomonas sp. UWO 241]|nr:hypothetical protein FOA52_015404 [Chlamydomonas sp. UWO 241]